MSILHMQTAAVRDMVRQLNTEAAQIDVHASRIRQQISRLSMDWWGTEASRFRNDLRAWAQACESQADDLRWLASRLAREVDEWEARDEFGAACWQDILAKINRMPPGFWMLPGFLPWITLPLLPPLPKPWSPMILPLGFSGLEFDWLSWGGDLFKTQLDLLNIAQSSPYTKYRSIGRFINKAIGNQRGGWVGEMDELGHLIKSPALKWFTRVGDGVSLGLGILSDLQQGDSLSKAVISESLEFVIDKGLYAIPVVGQVYMIYDIGLGAANLVAGGLEIIGWHDQAVQIQNTIDRIDIADNAADAIYDFGEYYITNPDRIVPALENVANAVVEYGAGLIDEAKDVVGCADDVIGDLFGF